MPPKTIPFSSSNVPQTIPFDASPRASIPEPQQSLAQKIWGGAMAVTNLAVGSVTRAGARTGDFIGYGATKGVAALTGNQDLSARADAALQMPLGNVPVIGTEVGGVQPGAAGVKQVAGEGLNAALTVAPVGRVAAGAKVGLEALGIGTRTASVAAPIVTGAGLGYAADQANQLEAGKTPDFKPGIGTAAGIILPAAGEALQPAGKGVYKSIIPSSQRDAELSQAYKARVPFIDRVKAALSGTETGAPRLPKDTAFDLGLKGTEPMLGIQARRAGNRIWNDVIAPELDNSSVRVDMPAFFKNAMENVKATTKELGDQNARIEALNSIMDEYANKPTATLSELQGFKEGWASHVPNKYYNGKEITQTYNVVRAELADKARNLIYKTLGKDVRQAYFDYGNLKSIQELGKNAMTGGKLKGGFGSFWNAIKDMALTPVATVGGRMLYRTGQGLEFVGPKGAVYISDIFSPKTAEFLLTSQPPKTEQPQSQQPVSSPNNSTSTSDLLGSKVDINTN